jgi:hypothetical protein
MPFEMISGIHDLQTSHGRSQLVYLAESRRYGRSSIACHSCYFLFFSQALIYYASRSSVTFRMQDFLALAAKSVACHAL